VVETSIKTKAIKGAPETDEEPPKLSEEAITFVPEGAANIFVEIGFKNVTGQTCPLPTEAPFHLTGKQQCLWLEILVDLLEHLIHCEGSESLLLFGKERVEFEALEVVTLNNLADFWDIEEVA
jgi:hypothetical protein